MRIVAGQARGRTILAPEGNDTRPTLDRVRENLFNILQWDVRDARVLDLFAGSGALALEAVSRGAAQAELVDKDPRAMRVIEQNVQALRFEAQCRVNRCEWQAALSRFQAEGKRFTLVFLDPPYAMRDLSEVLTRLQPLLEKGAKVVVEHRAGETPLVAEGFRLIDERRYGIAGIRIYQSGEA